MPTHPRDRAARSLDLARAAARRLLDEPERIEEVRIYLDRHGYALPAVIRERYAELLDAGAEALAAAMVEESDAADRLRQWSAWSAVMDPDERAEILQRWSTGRGVEDPLYRIPWTAPRS